MALVPTLAHNLIGQQVGRYRILEILGQGGMGIVYKAHDTGLDRTVAIKTLVPNLAASKAFVDRLWKEAKALAKLEEQHIVRIHDIEETPYGLFIIMEFVDGVTLKAMRKMPWRETLPILRQTLRAFDYAHRNNVIHRDVKPSNIMITREGMVKVMDFGLAKVQQTDAMETVTQGAAGTLYYLSPEQVHSLAHVDRRSDLYSLGMSFIEVLTGQLPFVSTESEFVVMQAIVEGKFHSVSSLKPDLPRPLARILTKAIELEPENRYQHAGEMLDDLERFEESVATQPDAPVETVIFDSAKEHPRPAQQRSFPRKRVLLVLALFVIAAAAFLASRFLLFQTSSTVAPDVLTLSSSPEGATVLLDGDSLGPTPLDLLPWRANKPVSLRLQKVDFFSVDTTLVLTDAVFPLAFDLAPLARLSLDVTPTDAAVLLDGEPVAPADRARLEVPPGEHQLQITRGGYESVDVAITVQQGDNPLLAYPLKAVSAETGTLTVLVQPWGDIYVDGQVRQRETDRQYKTSLSAGRHLVRVVHRDYGTWEEEVSIPADGLREVTVDFNQTYSVLVLADSDPKTEDIFWAEIYVDGNNTEQTTPDTITLRPGLHTIEVRRDGYQPSSRRLNINRDITDSSLLFSLKKQ